MARIGSVLASVAIGLSAPWLIGWSCDTSGKPSVESLGLRYDLVCRSDLQQEVSWTTSLASSVTLSILDEHDQTVQSESVPGSSNGWHAVDVSALAPGEYTLRVEADNAKGSDRREVTFAMVAPTGTWYAFKVFVERPKSLEHTGPWFGFVDVPVTVAMGQGLEDADDRISISENVHFRNVKWRREPFDWADAGGCTSPGLERMRVRQGTVSQDMAENTAYPLPSAWHAQGTYYCSVNWAPCNFGVSGTQITDSQVSFYLYVEAICN